MYDFSSILFYQTHWDMVPFVGNDYKSSKHKKLLIVGESFQMPEGSVVHHDAAKWYNETPNLSKEEHEHCSTCGAREYKSGRFGKEVERCLRKISSCDNNAWHQVASINYFLRPADNRLGVEDLWNAYGGKAIDCEYAIRNLIQVFEILKPDIVAFMSWLACKEAENQELFGGHLWNWTERRGINYIYTAHPSSPHWNKPMPIWYDKARGMTSCEFFCKWLCENWLI